MLTTARPLFLDVPATYADPAGLADQQAEGAVSLVVVHYPDAPPDSTDPDDGPPSESPLGPTYDAFVAVSGQLLAVARSTPDYRFPVTPATALARFLAHRDGAGPGPRAEDRPPTLSLYALDPDDCARFVETAYFAECLKLHVDGADSALLVARQVARSACRGAHGPRTAGVLEVNDFSDPARPRLALLDLDDLLGDGGPDDDALAARLAPHLDGVAGRVLLYDRAKNRAALPDRAGHGFGLDDAIEQANRLAAARRAARDEAPPDDAEPADDPDAGHVEAALRDRAARRHGPPPTGAPDAGLRALVAELQGARAPTAPPPTLSLSVLDEPDRPEPGPGPPATGASPPETPEPDPNAPPSPDAPDTDTAPAEREATAVEPRAARPAQPTLDPEPTAPHPLADDLDRLRSDVVALFEDAVGRDRARAHQAHVLDGLGLAAPVPAGHAVPFLRALLTADPPRRWHLFKRARGRVTEPVADRLMAFHVAHGHADDAQAQAAVHDVAGLWTRLHR